MIFDYMLFLKEVVFATFKIKSIVNNLKQFSERKDQIQITSAAEKEDHGILRY